MFNPELTQLVRKRVLMEIGHRVFPGEPEFDRDRQEWRVPLLCAVDWQRYGNEDPIQVGIAVLDQNLSFVAFPTRNQVLKALTVQRLGNFVSSWTGGPALVRWLKQQLKLGNEAGRYGSRDCPSKQELTAYVQGNLRPMHWLRVFWHLHVPLRWCALCRAELAPLPPPVIPPWVYRMAMALALVALISLAAMGGGEVYDPL